MSTIASFRHLASTSSAATFMHACCVALRLLIVCALACIHNDALWATITRSRTVPARRISECKTAQARVALSGIATCYGLCINMFLSLPPSG